MKQIIILVIVMVGLSFISCDDNSNDPQPIVEEKIVMPVNLTDLYARFLLDSIFSPKNRDIPLDWAGVVTPFDALYFDVFNSAEDLKKICSNPIMDVTGSFLASYTLIAMVNSVYPSRAYRTILYQNDSARSYRYQFEIIAPPPTHLAIEIPVYVYDIYPKLKEGYTVEYTINKQYGDFAIDYLLNIKEVE